MGATSGGDVMISYPQHPVIQTMNNNRVMLWEDYKVDWLVIPEGYMSDGASVPRWLWSIVPPFKPKYMPAVLAHDYLCDKELYTYADELFEKILLDIEDSVVTRGMIKAVRSYHKVRYKV